MDRSTSDRGTGLDLRILRNQPLFPEFEDTVETILNNRNFIDVISTGVITLPTVTNEPRPQIYDSYSIHRWLDTHHTSP